MRPTGIFVISWNGESGAASITQTWSVDSEATNARSFWYRRISGVGDGSGGTTAMASVTPGACAVSGGAEGAGGATDAPAQEASTIALVAMAAITLKIHPPRVARRPSSKVRARSNV